MAHINFLEPPRFSFRQFSLKDFELNYLWIMIILGVVILFMMVFGLIQQARVKALDMELAAVTAEARKASGQTDKPVVAKATLMDTLMQRVVWSPILNTIANHTPDTIALNYIKGASSGGRGLQLEGSAADVLATVRYEEELATLPIFSKVFLKSYSKQSENAAGGGAAAAGLPAGKTDAAADPKAAAAATAKSASRGIPSSQSTFEIQAWLK